MNGLPALTTVELDGWVLRFAEGYTNRANTVNPLTLPFGDIDSLISECEERYSRAGLDTIFKLTSASKPYDLEELLSERGYLPHGSLVNVQTLEIDEEMSEQFVALRERMEKRDLGLVREERMSIPWLMAFARMNSMKPETVNILSRMLHRIDHPSHFLQVVGDGVSVGCGYAVAEKEYLGLFDIIVDKENLRQVIGELVMLALMAWGRKRGAETAYLQVMEENEPALTLYDKLGFETAYQYWYRKKDCQSKQPLSDTHK